jgi:hypothetical protein
LFLTAEDNRAIFVLLLPERLLGVIARAFVAVAGRGYDLPDVEPDADPVPPELLDAEADLSNEGPPGLPGDKADLPDVEPDADRVPPELLDAEAYLFNEGPPGLPGDKADLPDYPPVLYGDEPDRTDSPPEPFGLEPELIDFSALLFRGEPGSVPAPVNLSQDPWSPHDFRPFCFHILASLIYAANGSEFSALVFKTLLPVLDSYLDENGLFRPAFPQAWDMVIALVSQPADFCVSWFCLICATYMEMVVDGNPDAVLCPEIIVTVTSLCAGVPSFCDEVFDSEFHVCLNNTVISDVTHPALVATLSFFLMLVHLCPHCQVDFGPERFIALCEGEPDCAPCAIDLACALISTLPEVTAMYSSKDFVEYLCTVLDRRSFQQMESWLELLSCIFAHCEGQHALPPGVVPGIAWLWERFVSGSLPDLGVSCLKNCAQKFDGAAFREETGEWASDIITDLELLSHYSDDIVTGLFCWLQLDVDGKSE